MNLELALETIRKKRLQYKSNFKKKETILTGIVEFDNITGGFDITKKHLIVGQEGCCPLLFANTIIDNIASLNRMPFKEVADFIRPKLLKLDKEALISLDDLDKKLQAEYDVIIAVFRPAYFSNKNDENGISTKNILEFKIIKGGDAIVKNGTLHINIKERIISSSYTANFRKNNLRILDKYAFENFENHLSQYIKQVPINALGKDLHKHFSDNYPLLQKAGENNAEVIYLQEPQPILFSYSNNTDRERFVSHLKPEAQFISISLENILNLIALYTADDKDFKDYYNESHLIFSSPTIDKITQRTAHRIIYQYQFEDTISAYGFSAEQIKAFIKHINAGDWEKLKPLDSVIIENGQSLLSQIEILLLPTKTLFTPNYYVARKIFNFLN
jgi:hypothetical protein